MASFKDPSFQDRVASARKAKQKALDQLQAMPPADEALMARRRQEGEARERALQLERTARAQERAAAKLKKAASKAAELATAQAQRNEDHQGGCCCSEGRQTETLKCGRNEGGTRCAVCCPESHVCTEVAAAFTPLGVSYLPPRRQYSADQSYVLSTQTCRPLSTQS